MRASDVMSAPVVTVTPECSMKDAAVLLASRGFTALPVADAEGSLIGVVTETDLVRDRFPRDPRSRIWDGGAGTMRRGIAGPAATVGEVMTSPLIALSAGTDVVDVVKAMREYRMRSMPVVDGQRLVGIVTGGDLVRVLARDDQAVAADVRRRLAIYGGPERWTVTVNDGTVTITDEFDDPADRHAAVLAEAVLGVTAVRVTAAEGTDADRDSMSHHPV